MSITTDRLTPILVTCRTAADDALLNEVRRTTAPTDMAVTLGQVRDGDTFPDGGTVTGRKVGTKWLTFTVRDGDAESGRTRDVRHPLEAMDTLVTVTRKVSTPQADAAFAISMVRMYLTDAVEKGAAVAAKFAAKVEKEGVQRASEWYLADTVGAETAATTARDVLRAMDAKAEADPFGDGVKFITDHVLRVEHAVVHASASGVGRSTSGIHNELERAGHAARASLVMDLVGALRSTLLR